MTGSTPGTYSEEVCFIFTETIIKAIFSCKVGKNEQNIDSVFIHFRVKISLQQLEMFLPLLLTFSDQK